MVGFTYLTFNLLINYNLINMSMWTASLAQINAGVITVIFSITPLLQGFFDLIIFGQKLTYNLWIGMFLMVAACALLSVQPLLAPKVE